jgi:hypothetical protein
MYLQIVATGIKYPIYENEERVIPIKGIITKKQGLPRLTLNEPLTVLYINDIKRPLEELEQTLKELERTFKVTHNHWMHVNKFNYKKLDNLFELQVKLDSLFTEVPHLVQYINYLKKKPKDISKLWECLDYGSAHWNLEQEEMLSLALTYFKS